MVEISQADFFVYYGKISRFPMGFWAVADRDGPKMPDGKRGGVRQVWQATNGLEPGFLVFEEQTPEIVLETSQTLKIGLSPRPGKNPQNRLVPCHKISRF